MSLRSLKASNHFRSESRLSFKSLASEVTKLEQEPSFWTRPNKTIHKKSSRVGLFSVTLMKRIRRNYCALPCKFTLQNGKLMAAKSDTGNHDPETIMQLVDRSRSKGVKLWTSKSAWHHLMLSLSQSENQHMIHRKRLNQHCSKMQSDHRTA